MSQFSAFAHNAPRAVPAPLAGGTSVSSPVEGRPMMSLPEQERWMRVKTRMRAEVGEEIFKSWFAAMDLAAVDSDTVRLSVPTRFLKSWVQSHYADKLLAAWKAEVPEIRRVDLIHRSAVLRNAIVKEKPAEPAEAAREVKNGAADRSEARSAQLPAQ